MTCPGCGRDLKPHCTEAKPCGWHTCSNRTCPVRYADPARRTYVSTSNTLERYDTGS